MNKLSNEEDKFEVLRKIQKKPKIFAKGISK